MSSSTSNAASTGLGECVVCGKKSSVGCSKCKAAGLDWMYFCSVEHQKLVWKAHRFACGKKLFTAPALTSAEAQDLWQIRTSQLLDRTPSSIIGGIKEILGSMGDREVEDKQAEAMLKIQLEDLQVSGDGGPERELSLRLYRHFLFKSNVKRSRGSYGSVTAGDIIDTLIEDPLGFLSFIESHVPATVSESNWYSATFRHRLLISIGAIRNETLGSITGDAVDPVVSWPLHQLLKFIKAGIPETEKEKARSLEETFFPALLEAIGVKHLGTS
ncbi:hypothetical protein JCM5350_004081 [Sporobolomyces pararoseus]